MKQPLLEQWSKLEEKVNQRNVRERVLIALSCWAVVYLVWEFIAFQPLNAKKAELQQRFDAVSSELVQLDAQQQVFVKALTADPNAGRRRELVAKQEQITQLDSEINKLSDGLIPAGKLPQLLHDVLQVNKSLTLVSMRSLPAQHLTLPYPQSEGVDDDDLQEELPQRNDPRIFKHGVKMTLRGGYFDVLAYLQAIENLEWRVYWELLDYQVKGYPSATVDVLVYTLSTEKGVFGE